MPFSDGVVVTAWPVVAKWEIKFAILEPGQPYRPSLIGDACIYIALFAL